MCVAADRIITNTEKGIFSCFRTWNGSRFLLSAEGRNRKIFLFPQTEEKGEFLLFPWKEIGLI